MLKKRFKIGSNFIKTIIDNYVKKNRHSTKKIVTRFPPEPNGYLHIGHAKAICLNFEIASVYQGICHLRFDDTNPNNESYEYVENIIKDIKWLGFEWKNKEFYTSDYFNKLYKIALTLIKKGKAYVDDLRYDEIRAYRGTLKNSGIVSPFRDRSVEENLNLFERMKNREFRDGEKVLRAKIDMSHSNILMRDPILYRIKNILHHRTGDNWCIYPMYDFAHCLCDSIEKVSHSFCTLEFENNRLLYNWLLNAVAVDHMPIQIEFARLKLSYTVLSKRKLKKLIKNGYVSGWGDPRLPTISGLRKRGYTPSSIRNFCSLIGVGRRDSIVDLTLLEHAIREDLNFKADRRMAVLNPIKMVITNYPSEKTEFLDAVNNPENSNAGIRKIPFSREIYIEKDDFMEFPSKKFFRLSIGREVRLRYAFFVTCVDFIKDDVTGNITEVHCIYDPNTRGGNAIDGRKVKSTLHWVSAAHAVECKINLYDRLFTKKNPDKYFFDENLDDCVNYNSLTVLEGCKLEPSLANEEPGFSCQFERLGYFYLCSKGYDDSIIFNRIVTLRDKWKNIIEKK